MTTVQVDQPPASSVRKFLALLEQSDIDFSEEIGMFVFWNSLSAICNLIFNFVHVFCSSLYTYSLACSQLSKYKEL